MSRAARLARRFFDRFEPVHAVTYFAPEVRIALEAMGFTGFWRGYFAARSAPLCRVPAEVVTAVFFNFSAERVGRTVPAIWEVADPEAVLAVRLSSAVTALQRYGDRRPCPASPRRPSWPGGRAWRAAGRSATVRRKFGAAPARNPVAALWRDDLAARTPRRRSRGDAAVRRPVRPESNVLHAAAGSVPTEFIKRSRDYTDEEWTSCVEALAARGLLTAAGTLTDSGQAIRTASKTAPMRWR